MNQLYKITEHYKVSDENYEIQASIVNGEINLHGAFHDPGDSSWNYGQNYESIGLPTKKLQN